jgi:hypothetical protein
MESLKGRNHSEDISREDNIGRDLKDIVGRCGLDASGSGRDW